MNTQVAQVAQVAEVAKVAQVGNDSGLDVLAGIDANYVRDLRPEIVVLNQVALSTEFNPLSRPGA